MATVRKRRGKWCVDYYDENKNRHIYQVDGGRDEAETKLAEIVKAGKKAPKKCATFQERAELWLETYARGATRASTYRNYEDLLRLHLYPVFSGKPIDQITRRMVREFIVAKQKEGFSRSSMRNILIPLRGIYSQAIEDEEIDRNPAEKMGKHITQKQRKEINPFTREEAQVFLDAVKASPDRRYYPFFLCALRTGIRQGELISLKGTDIDFHGRFIHVQRNLSAGNIELPKNGKTRRVDMSQHLTDTLQELLSKRRAEALRREMEKPAGERRDAAEVVNEAMEQWLFMTWPRRRRVEVSNLRKLFNRLLVTAKLRRIRFHDLRHTFASLLLQQGESPVYVKEQCGHSSIKMTVDTYGHLIPGGNRQAVDKLDVRVPTEKQNGDLAPAATA